ncbi:hypothetical protein CFC21_012999 [Triticum aestivum]|uniref:Uncharacterized protein n=2 Tax=Triticum aestivum TaxID=4565 RepID=A0A9R1DR52_WHEAT|nr:hypothetical protein CFC21_012999 [Triticum aestivum]
MAPSTERPARRVTTTNLRLQAKSRPSTLNSEVFNSKVIFGSSLQQHPSRSKQMVPTLKLRILSVAAAACVMVSTAYAADGPAPAPASGASAVAPAVAMASLTALVLGYFF